MDFPFFFGPMRNHMVPRLYVEAALGNLVFVEETLVKVKEDSKFYRFDMTPEGHFDELTGDFYDCVRARDRIAVAAYLHKWEAYTVRNAKLEKFWQPSPFPIELEG